MGGPKWKPWSCVSSVCASGKEPTAPGAASPRPVSFTGSAVTSAIVNVSIAMLKSEPETEPSESDTPPFACGPVLPQVGFILAGVENFSL